MEEGEKNLHQFRLYYNHTIHPELMRMEKQRKRLLWLLGTSVFVFIGIIILELYVNVFFINMFLTIPIALYIIFLWYQITRFRIDFKPRIINLILGYIDDMVQYEYLPDKAFPKSYFMDSHIFSSSAPAYQGEDYIRGQLGEVDFEMGEINVREFSKVRSRLNYVFKGVMLRARLQDYLKGNIYVLPEEFQQYLSRSIKQFTRQGAKVVTLKNPDFEKAFMVYSNKPLLAQELLTEDLQKKLVRYRKKVNKGIYISFVEKHIYVAVTEDKNLLEPHILSPNDDFYLIKEFHDDLELLFTILREFDRHTITASTTS